MNTSVGTFWSDNIRCTPNSSAIGLQGDDFLFASPKTGISTTYSLYTLMGGSGNDTYFASNLPVFIADTSGSSDTISTDLRLDQITGLYVVDGKHFVVEKSGYSGIAVADAWGSGKIEWVYSSVDNAWYKFDNLWEQYKGYAIQLTMDQIDNSSWLVQAKDYLNIMSQEPAAENTAFGFNESFYDSKYSDITFSIDSRQILTGGVHFSSSGKYEGRSPNIAYNQNYYLSHNPDVANAVAQGITTGYDHFVNSGQFEGRQGSAEFNAYAYLAANFDVASAVQSGMIGTAFQHFAQSGQYEGRALAPGFTEGQYLAANSDVAAAVQAGSMPSGYYHYAFNGCHEGRPVIPVETVGVYQAQDISV